jgi:hypothetical protein
VSCERLIRGNQSRSISSQVRIEHDLPLPMILMGETLANYVKSLDCRCELASEARAKTGKRRRNEERGRKLPIVIRIAEHNFAIYFL